MFPHAPQLFRGKGVTDDPASESYWKTVNGIRLSGMPSYKNALTDTQLWQVALLVAHANEISAPAKKELMPEPTPAAQSSASAPATAPASKRK
jgi:mono/diheme cytochrome c family protein